MAATAKIEQINQETPKVDQPKVWFQWENESQLWFNRFALYLQLGPKRSLQAAIAKEQEMARLVVDDQESTKKHQNTTEKNEQVSKLVAHVPGSWKAASSRFHWVERARAWDEHRINLIAEMRAKDYQTNYANKLRRVSVLDSMADVALKTFNSTIKNRGFSHKDFLKYLQQIQSIFRDIAHEMEGLDESMIRVLLRGHAEVTNKELFEKPETEKE